MTRGQRAVMLGILGLSAYLLAESFVAPASQPSALLSRAAIDAYQAVGSPALQKAGVQCRYTPSCSHYAEDAIAHYGTLGGVLRTSGRLFRCAPWGGWGYDPAVLAQAAPQETPEERRQREELERQQKQMEEELKKAFQHSGEAAAGGIACCIIWIVTLLVGLAVWIFVIVFVYKDAKARGDQNAVLWIVLCVVLGWIGLIVYLIARPKGDLVPCAQCKNKMMSTLVKCPHCGTDTGAAAAPPPQA